MSVISTCHFTAEPTRPAAVPLVAPGIRLDMAACAASAAPPVAPPAASRRLHRLSEVRRREGISRSRVAKRLGITVGELSRREQPNADMLLSELRCWQDALGVPMAELLNEPPGELSPPVRLRARLLRVMKTVRSIEELARQTSIKRLATMLAEQLVEAMPELKDAIAWPTGNRRRLDPLEPIDWRHFCKTEKR